MTTRRDFLSLGALTTASLTIPDAFSQTADSVKQLQPPAKPVIVTRVTGDNAIQEAYQMLLDGQDTLDAVHHVCLGRENDPKDHSVGLGGLPNEEGVVELDSCCMHGPSRSAGSVGGVQNIKNVCLVARKVYEHTGHVMLVAEGAERFAVDLGFPSENLLTDDARKIWMLWKENNSQMDWWGPGMTEPGMERSLRRQTRAQTHHGPPWPLVPAQDHHQSCIPQRQHPSGVVPRHPTPEWAETIRAPRAEASPDGRRPRHRRPTTASTPPNRFFGRPPAPSTSPSSIPKGEISGATTTSGLAWKLPGRLGDSPILGAGCYTDQDVGSAGATGSGEENIKVAGAHTIVELMRQGARPRKPAWRLFAASSATTTAT